MADDSAANRTLDDLNRNSPFKPVFFVVDSADLDEAGRATTSANAELLKKNPRWVVTIEGHCDERGTAEYNLALGERRAIAVKTFLVSLGIPPDRVRTISYGKEFPFDPAKTDEALSEEPTRSLCDYIELTMRKTSLVVFVSAVVISALAAATPARAQNREHLQMAAELRILQQQNQELANTLAQTIQLLNETAKALNSRIDQTNESMKKGFADQSLTLNTTAGDIRKTLAQTQDAATRLGELKEEVRSAAHLDPRVDLAPHTGAGPCLRAGSERRLGGGRRGRASRWPRRSPSTIGLSPERMYNTALSDYGGGNYTAAIQGFQEFLKAFPTSPRADDAQQYIGEAEFQQNHFEQAITAYNLVIQNYPKGDQVAWAYYKRGLAQSRLQQTAAARASFETVVKLFPDTRAGHHVAEPVAEPRQRPAPPATPPRKP